MTPLLWAALIAFGAALGVATLRLALWLVLLIDAWLHPGAWID
jgi:hypothetical protein